MEFHFRDILSFISLVLYGGAPVSFAVFAITIFFQVNLCTYLVISQEVLSGQTWISLTLWISTANLDVAQIFTLFQRLAYVLYKGPDWKYFAFAGRMLSITVTQFWCGTMQTAKIIWKQTGVAVFQWNFNYRRRWICPMGRSLPNLLNLVTGFWGLIVDGGMGSMGVFLSTSMGACAGRPPTQSCWCL